MKGVFTPPRYTWPMNESVPPPRPALDWRTLHIWQIQPLRDALLITAVVGVFYLGYVLSIVTVPLLLALLLAYLVEPVVRRITRSGQLSRPVVAVALIVIAITAVATPVILGLGVGILQGAGYVQEQAANVQALVRSVEQPADQAREARLPGRNWIKLRDWIVDIKAQADAARGGPAPSLIDPNTPLNPLPPTSPMVPGELDMPTSPPPPAPAPEISAPRDPPTPVVATPPDAGTSDDAAFKHLPPLMDAPTRADRTASRSAVLAYQGIEWAVQSIQTHGAELGAQLLQTGASAISGGFGLASWLLMLGFGFFLTSFFFYYLCTSYERVIKFVHKLIPERNKDGTLRLVGKMDLAISGFIRGRLTICAILVVYYTLAYWIIGTSVPLILGPLVGVLTLIPYISGIGVPIAILLLLLQPSDGGQSNILWIIGAPVIVYSIGQFLDDYIFTPRIQGQNTGMNTPTILFASIAGGVLFGFYGLLLAIPIAACVKISLQDIVWPRFKAWREGRAADPLPLPATESVGSGGGAGGAEGANARASFPPTSEV